VVIDTATGMTYEATVDVAGSGAVVRCDAQPGLHGPIVTEEWVAAQTIPDDPRVGAALQRRGVTDRAAVYTEPWPAGNFNRPYDDSGRRLGHCVFYLREHPEDQPWARPIQGIVAIADRNTNEVVDLIDEAAGVPIPSDPGRFDADAVEARMPLRGDLKPLHITQRDGPSFSLDGNELAWQNWRLRLAMHPIEGPVLHQVSYAGRSVLYRGSMAEMVVPYGDPQGQHFWRHVFDEGEVGMGRSANSLVLGCDCLGEIAYLDAPMVLSDGSVTAIEHAICIHEEDWNDLWRHNDRFSGVTHSHRNRRLAISFWATLGNYDYGYFWYLYQDGSIEIEVKLTGIVLASAAVPGAPTSPHEVVIASGLTAPHHQHFFSFRLDLDVDGTANRVTEVDVVADPPGPANPHGNAFRTVATVVDSEAAGRRRADPLAGRSWIVSNEESRTPLGYAAGYQVLPGASPLLLAQPDAAVARRAAFATEHLWVTAHAEGETRAAGMYPNPAPGRRWVAAVPGGGPQPGRHRCGALGHLRRQPRSPPGGVPGDAGGTHRLPRPAVRVLRPQPRPRRAAPGPNRGPGVLPLSSGWLASRGESLS
jgi:primary-amine oxidase